MISKIQYVSNNMQDEFENVHYAIIKEDNKRRETSQGIVQQEGLSPERPYTDFDGCIPSMIHPTCI